MLFKGEAPKFPLSLNTTTSAVGGPIPGGSTQSAHLVHGPRLCSVLPDSSLDAESLLLSRCPMCRSSLLVGRVGKKSLLQANLGNSFLSCVWSLEAVVCVTTADGVYRAPAVEDIEQKTADLKGLPGSSVLSFTILRFFF